MAWLSIASSVNKSLAFWVPSGYSHPSGNFYHSHTPGMKSCTSWYLKTWGGPAGMIHPQTLHQLTKWDGENTQNA